MIDLLGQPNYWSLNYFFDLMPAFPSNSLIGVTSILPSTFGLFVPLRGLSRSEDVKTAYAKHIVDVSELGYVVIV